MVGSAGDRDVLESGHITYGPAAQTDFAPIHVDRVITDGQEVTLGGTTMIAWVTSGHTKGCTSWQLDVRDTDRQPHRVFIHCSASVGGQTLVPESYPGQINDFRRTFDRVAGMRADVFLASHGEFFDLAGRRQRQQAGDANAFVDQQALGVYNRQMRENFQQEMARQSAGRQ
jgi:metallo-beta-lactamase class B